MKNLFNKIISPSSPSLSLPTISPKVNLKFTDYNIPSNNMSVKPSTISLSDTPKQPYEIHETNQIYAPTNSMTPQIAPDFYNIIDNNMIVNDETAGSFEQFGGNNYRHKYLKYKSKYVQLKTELALMQDMSDNSKFKSKYVQLKTELAQLKKNKTEIGGNLPLDQRTKYTEMYYYHNGDVNKLKEFFLDQYNDHIVKEIIELIRQIDTYIFNSFKKEEKIVFWVAINQEYLNAKKNENESRVNQMRKIAYSFKNWYDDWATYPTKEIANLEIIKDLNNSFDSI